MKKLDNKPYIFCPLRKNWYILTPEEWVRQHVTQYLLQDKNYHIGTLKAEHPVNIHGLNQRIDLLVYDHAKPFLLVECKRPDVQITQEILNQALRYNQTIKASWVYLTNGLQHIFAEILNEEVVFHKTLPKKNA